MANREILGKHARATHVPECVFLVLPGLHIRHETILPSKKRRPTLPKVPAIKELSRKGTYRRHGIKASFRRKDVFNITPYLIIGCKCQYRYVGNIQKTSRQRWNIKMMISTKTAIKNNLTNEIHPKFRLHGNNLTLRSIGPPADN